MLNLHPRHQLCTDEAQKAETVLSAVIYIYIYIYISYIYIYLYLYNPEDKRGSTDLIWYYTTNSLVLYCTIRIHLYSLFSLCGRNYTRQHHLVAEKLGRCITYDRVSNL